MYCDATPTRQILYKYASRRRSKDARMYGEEEERHSKASEQASEAVGLVCE